MPLINNAGYRAWVFTDFSFSRCDDARLGGGYSPLNATLPYCSQKSATWFAQVLETIAR